MPTLRVFTPRSTGIAVASGLLVAGALGQLYGAVWGLAVLNGLAAGAAALALFLCVRDGKFASLLDNARQHRVGMLSAAAMAPPMLFVDDAVGIELFNRGDDVALSLLFALTGFAAYTLGGIVVTVAVRFDGDTTAADPRLQRVVPPPGERRLMPVRVFTAQSTGIGIATGVLAGITLEQFLGATWGLATLNGLAAGVLALALSIGNPGGNRFDTTGNRRPDTWALACAVMAGPALFLLQSIDLRPADAVAVSLLFMLTGCASCTLGGIKAHLAYLDDEPAAADSRLHRLTPPPGERRSS